MENDDEWLAVDKLEHILFCFTITIFISTLINQTRYSLLRRWSIPLGSLVSVAAGIAKEIGDEIGLWHSSGASPKDLVADLIGTFIASVLLYLHRSLNARRRRSDEKTETARGIELV